MAEKVDLLARLSKISGIPEDQLLKDSESVDVLQPTQVDNQSQKTSIQASKSIEISNKKFEKSMGNFSSYSLEVDSHGNVHAVKFHLGEKDSYRLYIANYDIDERIIPAHKGVHPEQHLRNVKRLYFGQIQKKARSGYEALKHINYYRKFAWNPGQLTQFINELLLDYHHQKLA